MTELRQFSFTRFVFTGLFLALTSACGGGSSDDPGFIDIPLDGDAGFIGGDIGKPEDGGDTLTIELTDGDGNPTDTITSLSPGIVTVTFSGGADALVNIATTVGTVAPASALTDANGFATFLLDAGDQETGSGTVEAAVGELIASVGFQIEAVNQGNNVIVEPTDNVGNPTGRVNFQSGEANLRLGRFSGSTFVEGEIETGATSLSAAGSTPLSVTVVESDDSVVTSEVPVQFSSGCARLTPPLAELPQEVITVNGVATATFTASGCTGADTVSAAIVQGNSQTASVTLTVATDDVNSVAFLDAEPQTVALRGTGGAARSETASVFFQVLDTTGSPASGIDVAFSLSTTVGGLALSNPMATTNEDGIARAIVQAGNVSTSVRVTATITLNGTDLSTVSDRLIVSTGLPDQNSVSLSREVGNPGGGNIDGVTTSVNVRMADKFNNPVPDGTVAFFATEYGSIAGSCELLGGGCSVTWTSQEPRLPLIYNDDSSTPDAYVSTIFNRPCPDNGNRTGRPCPSSLGPIVGRQSAITVIAVGEESFTDTNGNGLYDVGEPFEDLPEAWLDKNRNGQFDNTSPLCTPNGSTITGRSCAEGLEEIFFDFNENGVYDAGNGLYNGSLCSQALAAAGQCSRDLLHVRGTSIILMSGLQEAFLYLDAPPAPLADAPNPIVVSPATGDLNFVVAVADEYNNPPSANTEVTVTADGCEISTDVGPFGDDVFNGAGTVRFTVINDLLNTTETRGTISIEYEGSTTVFTCFDQPL